MSRHIVGIDPVLSGERREGLLVDRLYAVFQQGAIQQARVSALAGWSLRSEYPNRASIAVRAVSLSHQDFTFG